MIQRAPAGVRIDGDLKEWAVDAAFVVIDPAADDKGRVITHHNNDPENLIKGAQDVSGRAVLAWDDARLYVAARVVDDDLRGIKPDGEHNVGPPGWAADSVMFQIHSFRQPLKTNTPYSDSPFLALRYEVRPEGRGQLLGNERGQLDKADNYWKLPQGSQFACRETDDGYVVEAAVPWAALEFAPLAGEILYCSFLLGDIDDGEALNQLGWNFRPPRERPVFRLFERPEAVAVLTPATRAVVVGSRWSVRYQADALAQDVELKRLVLACPEGKTVERPLNVTLSKGKRAAEVVGFDAIPGPPGAAQARLEAVIGGTTVALAEAPFEISPPQPPPPLVKNPAGEINRMRPDRIPHHAQDDHRRKIIRHGFVTDKTGYERYILTHVKNYIDVLHPVYVKGKSKWIDGSVLKCYALWKVTGDQKYADWVRQGLEVVAERQTASPDIRQLTRLMVLRHFIWQHDPETDLARPGLEQVIAKAWAHFAKNHEDWFFTEWGYHNRCWHRWGNFTLVDHFARATGQPTGPRMREYIDWHERELVRIGDSTDNSSGYHWVFFHYPVVVHAALGTLEELPQHQGYVDALTRYRQCSSPSGAVPHFGDTSGWLTGAGAALGYYEMMGRLTRDGRFRWQAHRIAEYLYNHVWPRHDQYHGPRDNIAAGFCLAWLWADDSIGPKPPSTGSRVTFRPRVVKLPDDEKGAKPGLNWGKLVEEKVPDKLILSSGNGAEGLWALVELLEKGGHCGQLPGHVAVLMRHDAALLAGQGYYEKSQDFNNVVWVEDLEGIAADPRPVRTEAPRLVEDPQVTHARIRVLRYGGLPITAVRDIVFVKNAFLVVKDRLTFHAAMKVRVGPCWQTRNLGPDCGGNWFNTYYDQLYHTGLGLGRGVHAVRNPAWDLLVVFSPRSDCRQSVLDRYDDNPYRVSPIQLRQVWTGIARRGETRTFTTVLLPHAPAFDLKPYVQDVQFLVDNDSATLVRVRVEVELHRHWRDTYWVQLQQDSSEVESDGWVCDAELAVVRRDRQGRAGAPVMVGGARLLFEGQDLAAKARRPTPQVVYTVADEADE